MNKINPNKLKEIYFKTKDIKETAKILGVTRQGVLWRVKKMGIFREEWHKRKRNDYIEENDFIILFSKNGEKIYVDKNDFEKIKDHTWCVSKTGYAVSRINK